MSETLIRHSSQGANDLLGPRFDALAVGPGRPPPRRTRLRWPWRTRPPPRAPRLPRAPRQDRRERVASADRVDRLDPRRRHPPACHRDRYSASTDPEAGFRHLSPGVPEMTGIAGDQ